MLSRSQVVNHKALATFTTLRLSERYKISKVRKARRTCALEARSDIMCRAKLTFGNS